MKSYLLIFLLLVSFYHLSSQTWEPFDNDGLPYGWVEDMEEYRGELYIAGNLGYGLNNIIKWDGNSWWTVKNGITDTNSSSNGTIWDLEVFDDQLFVAGEFTQANGIKATNIVKWNGVKWKPVGNGMDNIAYGVWTLKAWGDKLYAGGWFPEIDGDTVNHIAVWDRVKWRGVGKGFNSDVVKITVFNEQLHAGGYFTRSGEDTLYRIARWNGINWLPLAEGIHPNSDLIGTYVRDMIEYKGELIVGGPFDEAGTVSAQNIGAWNGSSWRDLNFGLARRVETFEIYDNKLYLGGDFWNYNYIAHWDGDTLIPAAQGVYSGQNYATHVWSLKTYNKNLFVGGHFQFAGTDSTPNLAEWSVPLTAIHTVKQDLPNIQAVPNPNSNGFRLSLPASKGYRDVILYDILGNLIKQERIGPANADFQYGRLPAGIYIYAVYDEKGLYSSGKIIAQ
ncbi:MAG: T9SS type A sorting domain-containing protein [Bacteroidetes bacterium]|nr:T9SS type A sorting domain-containing protein [Bacteroidota bacterium]